MNRSPAELAFIALRRDTPEQWKAWTREVNRAWWLEHMRRVERNGAWVWIRKDKAKEHELHLWEKPVDDKPRETEAATVLRSAPAVQRDAQGRQAKAR